MACLKGPHGDVKAHTERGKTWGMWVECSGVPRLKVRLVNPNQKGFSKFYGGFI